MSANLASIRDSAITVDRTQRRHYGDAAGRYYSVTTICEALVGGFGAPDPSALERGTDVHAIFALAVLAHAGRGEPPTVHPRYEGYYQSLQAWIERVNVEPVLVETPSVCPTACLTPVAGTPDLLATITHRGRRVLALVEVKSGPPAPWHKIQIQAYRGLALYRESRLLLLLYLHADGCPARERAVEPNAGDKIAFYSALNVLLWRETHP